MNKKTVFLNKLYQLQDIIFKNIFVFYCSILLIILSFITYRFISNSIPVSIDSNIINQSVENNNLKWDIDVETEKFITIKGWLFDSERAPHNPEYKIVLKDINNDRYYSLPYVNQVRNDVVQSFNIDDEYKKSGFVAKTYSRALSLNKTNYEIILIYSNNGVNYKIDTKMTLLRADD